MKKASCAKPDLTGQVFNGLTVLEAVYVGATRKYRLQCPKGHKFVVDTYKQITGNPGPRCGRCSPEIKAFKGRGNDLEIATLEREDDIFTLARMARKSDNALVVLCRGVVNGRFMEKQP